MQWKFLHTHPDLLPRSEESVWIYGPLFMAENKADTAPGGWWRGVKSSVWCSYVMTRGCPSPRSRRVRRRWQDDGTKTREPIDRQYGDKAFIATPITLGRVGEEREKRMRREQSSKGRKFFMFIGCSSVGMTMPLLVLRSHRHHWPGECGMER